MFDFIVATAYAQEAAKNVPQQNPLFSLLPFVAIFFIFYFLMIRPQKKKMQEEQALLKSLAKGDEVYTKSGIIGTIIGLSERVVTLKISEEGAKLKILRDHIGGMAKGIFEKPENSPSKK